MSDDTHIPFYTAAEPSISCRQIAKANHIICIKAVFLPDFGGRLWSLTDKTTGKNLLYIIIFKNRSMDIRRF